MTTLTNEESSIALAKQAKSELLASAGKDWKEAERLLREAAPSLIAAHNLMRSAGIKLLEASGTQRMFDFWNESKDQLPPSMTQDVIHRCISIARREEPEAENLTPVRPYIQPMFESVRLLEAPRREVEQVAHERNIFSDWVSSMASIGSLFRKFEKPMEKWERDELAKFVQSTEEVVALNQKAKGLLV